MKINFFGCDNEHNFKFCLEHKIFIWFVSAILQLDLIKIYVQIF